jgi:arginine:pyruvate transaminase
LRASKGVLHVQLVNFTRLELSTRRSYPRLMKLASIATRLSTLGSEKWSVHIEGKRRRAAGEKLIFLSIGEPDLPPPQALLDEARNNIKIGRLGYSPGTGDIGLCRSLARFYTKQTGRDIGANQFMFVPGTQAGLSFAFLSILEPGDEVLMFDPYYATYEAVVTAPGGVPVAVKLDPDRGFHPDIEALEKALTPNTKAILLNSPSNPTGAVFTAAEIRAIGNLAIKHDLWIVSDEVYATMIHGGHRFTSPFFYKDLEERTIVVSSISKSHAVPGFRCGWIAGSADYCAQLLPVSETMLFGSQPFLEDALSFALDHEFEETNAMRDAYWARGKALVNGLAASNKVKARMPEGGMFVMVDVRATGLSGDQFARKLLADHDVVTMPGESFGAGGAGHLRVALTVDETIMAEAAQRIVTLAASLN